jgi:hypothetical protein
VCFGGKWISTWYEYRRVGKLEDGTQVLSTRSWTGGSGVFVAELWVRFEIGRGYYPEGEPYDQLIMRLVRLR